MSSNQDDGLLHSLFEYQCEKTPNNIAVVDGDESITYQQLNQKAEDIAASMIESGIPQEAPVALLCERSIECVASILGILKAGCAFVPIDRNYPQTRIEYVIKKPNISYMITDSSNQLLFGKTIGKVKIVNLASIGQNKNHEINQPVRISPKDLAYILFTSGTTGQSKGVKIEHRSVVNTIRNQVKILELGENDRCLCLFSIAFDAFISELFYSLSSGATAYLFKWKNKFSPKSLQAYIKEHEITVMTIAPAILKSLSPDGLSALQKVLSVGEACPLPLMQKWAKEKIFFNGYGPTEAAICTHMKRCNSTDKIVSIGSPLDGVKHYVLEDSLEMTPVGQVGELCLSGVNIARGYARFADQSIIKNPFDNYPYHRLYRTGDLVRVLDNGELEFVGRKDHQFHVNGCRVNPFEITTALTKHPDVTSAVTVAIPRKNNNKVRITVFYNALNNKPLLKRDLRNFLSLQLRDYMLPADYIQLDEIPLDHNLKVSMKKLIEESKQKSNMAVAPAIG